MRIITCLAFSFLIFSCSIIVNPEGDLGGASTDTSGMDIGGTDAGPDAPGEDAPLQDIGVDVPADCTDGQSYCRSNQLFRCDGGQFVPSEVCDAGCNNEGTACNPVVCNDGERTCRGNFPSVCSGNMYQDEEECEYGCVDGACLSCPATPICQGNERLFCDGEALGREACRLRCDDGRCVDDYYVSNLGLGQFTGSQRLEISQQRIYDTDECRDGEVVRDANGGEMCVVKVGDVQLSNLFRLNGSRAFVIVASGDVLITQEGLLSARGTRLRDRDLPGPGGHLPGAHLGAGGDGQTGPTRAGTGGGGGGANTAGAAGGVGGTTNGGVAGQLVFPADYDGEPLLVGGAGGNGYGDGAGRGGASGGAVQISARGTITILGKIWAGGGGGRGGQDRTGDGSGGGGGGGGGTILLEAPTFRLPGLLSVAGGAGGGGGYGGDGRNGQSGGDRVPQGGAGGNFGTSGGNGAGPEPVEGVDDREAFARTGGGGGAAGVVITRALSNPSVNVNPPASLRQLPLQLQP